MGAAPKNAPPPGDPPGNNGTIKVKRGDPPEDNTYDTPNEPHGTDCKMWVGFFGFDQGQMANITFTAHPPTKAKDDTPLISESKVPISDDEAGGGPNDVEQPSRQYGYDLTAILYEREVQAHPKQGFHIKLSVSPDLEGTGGHGTGPVQFRPRLQPPALEPDVHAGGRRQTRHHDAAWHDLRRVGDR